MKFNCGLFLLLLSAFLSCPLHAQEPSRPNILFALADDWGYPHAGAYGDPVVKTPAFDRLAREGALFEHAYVSCPSCTPSRGAILTGQHHWRLEGAGNLWSVFPDKFETYPETLERAGYEIGFTGKGWGPGKTETPDRNLTGRRFKNFQAFLESRKTDQPFCFWLGGRDPHRPYEKGSGAASGMDLEAIHLPACFPDCPEVRSDVADYYWEVQRFDRMVGEAIEAIEGLGELDRTLVVMTGDHGMPFPRCKSNLYDTGVRVPLAVRWPTTHSSPGKVVSEFVSLTDLAPTFFEVAGLKPSKSMTGRSLLPLLDDDREHPDLDRDFILFGKERHVPAQEAPDWGGYPCRGIRTKDFLFIKNYRADRWPAGTPNYKDAVIAGGWYADCDNGPTKTLIIAIRDKSPEDRRYYELSFGKRPEEELYDLSADPEQFENLAGSAAHAKIQKELSERLNDILVETSDPRVLGHPEVFEDPPYLGGAPKHPDWKEK